MAQNGKLMPNLDQNSTKLLNLTVLQRIDPFVEEILITAAHVTLYEFNIDNSQWSRKDVEGSLFVVKRNTQPRFQFIVMNRRNTDNLVENLLEDFEFEIQIPYLLYRNSVQEVNGIWFYNTRECEEVANLFTRILNAYSKVPTKSQVAPAKSDFEELEAVPTMAVMDGPLEPSSTAPAADVADDPSFVNFFSTAMAMDNGSNTSINTKPNHPPTVTSIQTPALLSAPIVLMPLLEKPDPKNDTKRLNNLVKPSTFYTPAPPTVSSSSSSPYMLQPPVSTTTTSLPIVPSPLQSPATGIIQRPYGAPLLQPFPPPTPPPSLTPVASAGAMPNHVTASVITREKVREALLVLAQSVVAPPPRLLSRHYNEVQPLESQTSHTRFDFPKDNQFIDLVYRALLNAHPS